nr:putative ribonuclease H-like domain-containing protein [Tanacetum cinerariifolium]
MGFQIVPIPLISSDIRWIVICLYKFNERFRAVPRTTLMTRAIGTVEDARLLVKELSKPLSDDDNVLLRTPRQHNMYSVDLNNIVPHKDLTCLVAKASTDECMIWHRRLGTNSTNISGTKDAASQEVKKNVSSLRYIALPNWVHDALLESSSSKPQDDCSSYVPKSSRNTNPTATLTNPPADELETLTVETPIPTVSSPVPTACFTDSPEPSSDARLISKRVANQVETPSLDNILTLANRFEDILGVTTNSDEPNGVEADVSNMETTITASPTPTVRIHKGHPKSQIISRVDTPIQTRNESKEIFDALQDPSWVEAMQDELLQFKIQNVWTLVDCPKGVRPIGTKCVLKNKKDERGIVIRNKVRLVAQGHTQKEGIDYDEVFAPVARIEAIRLFLAYASFIGFTVYQMDVKSAFLYGTIDEEVYVMQPPGFQDLEFPARVYKVEKAMYRLHQAPRAWYDTLFKYLLTNGFQRGTTDQTLFIRRQRGDFILVQVYVDDIIFGSSNP